MTLINRLLHNAPTCRAKVEEDDRFGFIFKVEPRMLTHSEVDKSSSVRAVIMKSSVEDPSPDDRYFFRPQLIPEPDSDGASVIISSDGVEKLGLEEGDTIVYIIAPADAFGKFDGPLENLGAPVRNKVAEATGRKTGPQQAQYDDGERPEKRDVTAVDTEVPLWQSSQVTLYSNERNKLGAVPGDMIYVEMTHNSRTVTYTTKLDSSNHVNVPSRVHDKLSIAPKNSTGDNRTEIDKVEYQHAEFA